MDVKATLKRIEERLESIEARLDRTAMGQTGGEYLNIEQLAQRIPYSESYLRKLIHRGEFVEGVHYSRPTGRIIFFWTAVERWLRGRSNNDGPRLSTRSFRTR